MLTRLLIACALTLLAVSPAMAQKKAPAPLTKTTPTKKGAPVVKPGAKAIILEGATVEQLTTIKGVGPAKAKALVAHMKANGPFNTWEELEKVKGIGPATIKNMQAAGVKLRREDGKKGLGASSKPGGGKAMPVNKTPLVKKSPAPGKAPNKNPSKASGKLPSKKSPKKLPGK